MVNDPTKERLVSATVRLLREKGPSGTGTAQILTEAGAQRGSLYFHFPAGKDELVRAAVQDWGLQTAEVIRGVFDEPIGLPERVERYFEVVARGLLGDEFRYGCAVGATTLDLAAGSADVRALTGEVFDSWTEAVADHLRAGGIEEARAAALATALIAGAEGATMLARAKQDLEPVHATGRMLAAATREALR